MKKLFCAAVIVGFVGCSVNLFASEKPVHTHITFPADKHAQGVRVEISQLQKYFAKRHLEFAMVDILYQDNVTMAMDSSKKLLVTNPHTKEKIGYIRFRFAPGKFGISCYMKPSESAVCENLTIKNLQFLDIPKDGVVQVLSLDVRHERG